MIIKIKVGRFEYEITGEDKFLDNGNCVQLFTQSKEPLDWGHRPNPHLSKRAIKSIGRFERVQHEHDYATKCELFSLKPSKAKQ